MVCNDSLTVAVIVCYMQEQVNWKHHSFRSERPTVYKEVHHGPGGEFHCEMQLKTNFISFGQRRGDPQDVSKLFDILAMYNVDQVGLDFPQFSDMANDILQLKRVRYIVLGEEGDELHGGDHKRRRHSRSRSLSERTIKQTSRALEVFFSV